MLSSIDALIDVQSQLRYPASRAVYVGEYASSSAPIRSLEVQGNTFSKSSRCAATSEDGSSHLFGRVDILLRWWCAIQICAPSYLRGLCHTSWQGTLIPAFFPAFSNCLIFRDILFRSQFCCHAMLQIRVSHRKATEGVYKCDNCHKTFGHRDDVRRHKLAVHDKIKNFFCEAEGCQKGFLLPDALKMHGKTHSNERPHYCPLYGKDYKSEQTWKQHVKEVHHYDGSQFMCSLWSTRYHCQRQFVEHLKKHDMILEKSMLNQTVSHQHQSW